ncbi:MAG: hypothetical protein ABIT01_20000, partial [Thermoanaerobaculia bacterium]
ADGGVPPAAPVAPAAAPEATATAAAAAGAADPAPSFTLDTGGKEFVPRNAVLLLRASRKITEAEGRFAVLLGALDVTDLFLRTSEGLSLGQNLVRLPSGTSELVVYAIGADGVWSEAGKIPLKVLTVAGLESAEVKPKLDLGLAGTLDEGEFPEPETENPRRRFQDFTGQLGLEAKLVKSGWTMSTSVQASAFSNQQQALRFSLLGEDAPKVDLASYVVQVQKGKTSLTVGQVSFGQDKYIINSFSSRGLVATVGLGRVIDIAAAAMSSVAIVGYENLLGLESANNRFLSARLGLEFLPAAPGALRLEATVLDTEVRPQARFQEGVVDDAEKSRGLGLRALASVFAQRVRIEGGVAYSKFTNPPDPTLNPNGEAIPVKEVTKRAEYATVSADVLRDLVLGTTARGSIGVVVRYDRVDPLFRSPGASNQADLEQAGVELNTILGPAAIQLGAQVQKDNLNRLPTLLTTRSRRQNATVTLPLAALLTPTKPSVLLPQLGYTFQRAEQVGSVDLVAGEFTPTFVPSQASITHAGTADWNIGPFRLGYRLTLGLVDNRQEEREGADSSNLGNAVQLGVNPHPTLQLSGELSFERQRNDEPLQIQKTNRVAGQASWAFTKLTSLAANFNRTVTQDDSGANRTESLAGDGTITLRIAATNRTQKHGISGQAFLRYGYQESYTRSSLAPDITTRRQWVFSSGLTMSLF